MANLARRAVPAHLAEHEDDEHGEQRGYVKGTDFALPYFSQWSRLHAAEVSDDLLRHVNCGYLSTHGVAPTLLALKQHAQSLCILIHALNPTLQSAEIAGDNPAKAARKKGKGTVEDAMSFQYELNDAFDFLNDLAVPYTNDDPNHSKPLMALVNEVRGRHEAHGTTYHCPFAETTKPRDKGEKGEKQKPYANHHTLIMHANACLERLDHEFSSTGGLLSLLPPSSSSSFSSSTTSPNNNPDDLTNARNSLLGQWLHFTQSLVARMHDLEQSYGHALDALAGEAAVPQQHLSALGPDARSRGRALLAFPQDRWLLVNAGADVLERVHLILDRREAVAQAREAAWRRNGVVSSGGEGTEFARGIVPVDLVTRYYRLAGKGRESTLFVLPAWEHHPGVGFTRETEGQPTVVACVQPKFPERATELEKRFTARINAAQKTEVENLRMRSRVEEARAEVGVLRRQNKMLAKTRDALMLSVGEADAKLADKVHVQRERAGKAERAAKEVRRERDEAVEREEALREEVEALRREVAALKGGSDRRRQCGAKRGDQNRGLPPTSFIPPPFAARTAMLPPVRADALPAGAGPRSSSMRGSTAIGRHHPGPRHRRAASVRAMLTLATLGLATRTSAEPALPYTPTTILLPPDGGAGGGTAFIFAPGGDSPNAVDFLSLDISTLRGSSSKPTILTSTLPFLSPDTGDCNTFAPSLLRNGTITVLAGDCSAGSTSSLWTYTPSRDPSSQWTQLPITASSTWDNAQSGPYHLGGMLSFSAQLSPVLSAPTLYLYGGMCPFPNPPLETLEKPWQSKATYSNRMLRLNPPSSSSSSSAYTLSYASPTGQQPPVAEAGFTLTELTPSLSNRSSNELVTQQTSHVLLGGHTQNAFVNMSTAAVWSLPEETWSFVGIAPPPPAPGKGKADLARGAAAAVTESVSVDSRSGHTAVLSEDGTRLVVYGGWVGDVRTAAEPQLAVVKVGVGLGDWEWEVPEQAEGGGGGVFGHGAVVLPGNVMMVYGGYEISGGGGGGGVVTRRQVGGGAMFYNITSMSWSDEYVRPLTGGGNSVIGGGSGGGTVNGGAGSGGGSSGSAGDGDSDSDGSSLNRNLGLGLGLGIGLLVALILAALVFRWFRRRQQRRAARDETLRGLAQGVNGSLPRGLGEDDEMLEQNHGVGMFPWTAAAAREWYTGGDDPYMQGQRSLGYESLRGGAKPLPSLYIPPPPSASSFSGRPRAAKGLYQPTSSSSYDFTPLNRASNRIGPIYEADEDEDEDGDLGKGYPLSPDKEERDDDDPFLTPTLNTPVGGLFPPAAPGGGGGGGGEQKGKGGQEQHADVQGWVSDVDAASPTLLAARTLHPSSSSSTSPAARQTQPPGGGRISLPLRRGASTKSARHSLVSALTSPTTAGGGTDASSSSAASTTDDGRTASNLSERSDFSFVHGAGGGGGNGNNNNNNNNTTGAEDRILLSRLRTTLATTATTTTATTTKERLGSSSGGSSNSASGNSYNTGRSNFAALQAEGPSLFREEAVGGDVEEEDDDYVYLPGSPSKYKPRRRSWLGSLKRVFSGGGTPESGSNASLPESPTREGLLFQYDGAGAGPSSDYYDGRLYGGAGAGAGLQQRRTRQGREAWLGGDGNGDEEEWDRDLERAAEQRTVQIMFTVPREALRVVNAEVEREESVLIVDPEEDEDYGGEAKVASSTTPEPSGPEPEPEPALLPPPRLELPAKDMGKAADRLSAATLEPPGGVSRSPSLRAASITSTTLHTAEAVRLERPRRRVLDLVESIESRSREGSPAGSPVRGS
ncbi:hypothetical protein C8A00DRAFT_41970 [Chaetomidium leptoderma]|uniref:Uncharacterized protein n=1 Tax=Chaetomidium leptoderma TaxID=669021 RepID=A0AAN6ZXB3_9PEZI|nr:hypothetical protein C8A00DRAFT_41970 [Chaetomidium leptoderma]